MSAVPKNQSNESILQPATNRELVAQFEMNIQVILPECGRRKGIER